ncbi:hypothetical protein H8E07_12745 [bacterium]|nr:hypothetical protein [bacterium]
MSSSRHVTARRFPYLCLFMLALAATPAGAGVLQNDSYVDGGTVAFQGGFVAGETAAVRLIPAQSGTQLLEDVHFLLGGAGTQVFITLNIWRDTGPGSPGVLLYTNDYSVIGSDDTLHIIDLTGQSIDADGGIWVGLEFQHTGYPSVARDDDGITPNVNYIDASGLGWVESGLLGLTGDWVIRATAADLAGFTVGGTITGLDGALALQNNGTDDSIFGADGPFTFAQSLANGSTYDVSVILEPAAQDCYLANGAGTIGGADVTDVLVTCIDESTVAANDGWEPGQNLNFQAGFAPDEIAASRFTPVGAGQRRLTRVLFMYGGHISTGLARLHVWDDSGGAVVPGTELFAADYQLTGGTGLQSIDLSAQNILVSDDYRVGIEFEHFSLPSVSRDDDGLVADRNFIYVTAGTWHESGTFGLTGDWIIRAVDVPAGGGDFAITSVADLPNDQGRQVRVAWEAAPDDDPGSGQPVTGYTLFRRIDDGFKSGAPDVDPLAVPAYPPGDWDFLTTVPSFGEATYSTIVPTVADSTIAEGMHWSAFFVRAMTDVPSVFQDSPPDSGYSVDNLVPEAPQGLMAAYAGGGGVDLAWEESPEADFDYFKVYRGDAPGFVIDPGNPYHTTTAPDWHDAAGGTGNHYRVSTVDFAGNESEAVAPGVLSGVAGVPTRAVLMQNHPNPFNPATRIRFSLATGGHVRLGIFDSRGAAVRDLVAGPREAGVHEVHWDGFDDRGRPAGSGVYYYRLLVDDEPGQTRRMSLVK